MTVDRTTTSLLRSLHDPSQDAVWAEFDARFRPVLMAFAQRLGVPSAEAEDLAQQTLVEFLVSYRSGGYDRSRGRLSSWIIAIARNLILDRREAAARRPDRATLDSEGVALELGRLLAAWDEEEARLIVARAMEILRAGRTTNMTMQAFELVAIRGVPADEAARECGMTVDEVYTAKNRVAKRLRSIVARLTNPWRDDYASDA